MPSADVSNSRIIKKVKRVKLVLPCVTPKFNLLALDHAAAIIYNSKSETDSKRHHAGSVASTACI